MQRETYCVGLSSLLRHDERVVELTQIIARDLQSFVAAQIDSHGLRIKRSASASLKTANNPSRTTLSMSREGINLSTPLASHFSMSCMTSECVAWTRACRTLLGQALSGKSNTSGSKYAASSVESVRNGRGSKLGGSSHLMRLACNSLAGPKQRSSCFSAGTAT
eukprot:3825667-Amphidinium_carterae.1